MCKQFTKGYKLITDEVILVTNQILYFFLKIKYKTNIPFTERFYVR